MPSKLLLVGDVHAVPEDLDDCRALIGLIQEVSVREHAGVVFMGDQYNTFSVIRTEVMAFWRESFRKLAAKQEVFALVGNHDYSGAGILTHAMMAHEDYVTVVDKPHGIVPGVLAVPFFDDHKDLVAAASTSTMKTLLCHATFEGAQYDNGYFAPDAISADLFPQENIISGHIHKPANFGKVTYVGAPRWRTLSDADIERAIWLYEFADDGSIISKTPFDTGTVCRQIRYRKDCPEDPITETLDSKVDWRIDIKGPAEYIEARKKELAGPGVKVRTFKTTEGGPKIRESDGIDIAFTKYLERFSPRHGTDKAVLTSLARERLHV